MADIEFDFDDGNNVSLDTPETTIGGVSFDDDDGHREIELPSSQPSSNKKKKRVTFRSQQSYQPPPPDDDQFSDDQIDEEDLLDFAPPSKVRRDGGQGGVEQVGGGDDDDEYGEQEQAPGYNSEPQGPPTPTGPPTPGEGFNSIDDEKEHILKKFVILERKGLRPSKRFTHYSDILEMRQELKRLTHALELEHSLAFSKKMLMACVTGLEFLNNRFDPFNIELNGWSENVMSNVNDYDNVFEKLHDKYSDRVNVAPEIELIFMVGGSAFMFHLTNTLFKTKLPNMEAVMKQNPDMMKNLMSSLTNQGGAASKIPISAPGTSTVNNTSVSTGGGRREMRGPVLNVMNSPKVEEGNLPTHLLPQSVSELPERPMMANDVMDELSDLESLSDSISVGTEDIVKDLTIKETAPKRGRKKRAKKNEMTL